MTFPPWGIDAPRVYGFFNGLHVATSYLFVALIALHIAAAVRHALSPRDTVLRRMLPL